jgi:2-dehydropantoate 2-reductase
MRIALLGTGAMACLFGARLAPLAEVNLVGTWAEGLAAIQERGIVLEDAAGASTVRVRAAHLNEPAAPADLALVLVKAWQTPTIAARLPGLLKPDSLALTLQNGIGNWEMLMDALGAERAWPGVTTQGATLLGPAHVREGGRGLTHLPEHPRLTPLAELLRAAGFETTQSPITNLHSLLWGKLVVNCGINALTALLRVPNGELLNRPDATVLMERAAEECAAVASALNYQLPFTNPAERVRAVARATAINRSSMFQDILRGAPTEIDAINGAAARLGQQLNVPTPVNETLWRLVKALVHAE